MKLLNPTRLTLLAALILTGCAGTTEEAVPLTYAEPLQPAPAASEAGNEGSPSAEPGTTQAASSETGAPGEANGHGEQMGTSEAVASEPALPADPATDAAQDETAFEFDPNAENAVELSVWRSPEFKRQFALSFAPANEIEPKNTAVEVEDLQRVQKLIEQDREEDAIEFLISNTTAQSNANYDMTLANLYFGREELDKAARAYEQAIAKHPKFQRAWKNLGLTHFRKGDYDSAQECLGKVIELGGSDGTTYGLLGVCYTNSGNAISAESAFRMASILEPLEPRWKMGLARSFFSQQRFDAAAHMTGYMIEQNPENVDLWMLQANAYLMMGKTLAAAENFELVDRMGGSTAQSLALLGDIYTQDELFDMATSAYVRALRMDGAAGVERALQSAKVLASRGANDQSERLATVLEGEFADELGETEAKELLRLKARIALATGAGDDEAAVLVELLELDPLDGDALIKLGQHARRNGDVEQAIFYFERAQGVAEFEGEALVRHAQALVSQGSYGQAVPLLRRAQELDPKPDLQLYLEQVERLALGR